MKKLTRILSVLLVLCMVLAILPSVFAADETVDFEFLVTSDLHGQIYATDYTVDQSKSGTHIQGLTRLATYIEKERETYGDNLFVADLGDTIQGAPLTYYYAFNKLEEQQPAMKAFRNIGYDLWVIGNHEFNYGLNILNKQLADATAPATATEKSVNVCMANYLKAETNSADAKDWATWKDYAPYIIKDFDGVKVAIIGFGNPNIAKWDIPANWEGIYFADILETYKHYEAEMLEKADMIVVMSHSGLDSEMPNEWDSLTRLITNTDSISLVFSGHEHGQKVHTLKNKAGKDINVLQPGTKAAAIAQAKVSFNKTTKEATIIPEAKAACGKVDGVKVPFEGFELNEELVALIKPYEDTVWNDFMNIKIGEAAEDFSAADLGTKPSAFMDLINTVQMWGAYDNTGLNTPEKETDDTPAMLSISAPLTVGDNPNIIAKGDIHLGDLFKLYRFENWFYQITMSGEEVHQWLEFAASKIRVVDGKPTVTAGDLTYYDVIYGDGFSYVIDYKADVGSRIVSMTYNGKGVMPGDQFTVVVNNYRYNGGGNYVKWLNDHGCVFEANDPKRVIYSTQFDMIQGEDNGQARTLLLNYIKEKNVITPTITSTWKLVEGDLDIAFTNDVHGAYENYAYAATIAKDADLLVDAGDNIQGSVATTLTNGQCMVDLMKAVGYDVAVPGNHEFDYGFDRFLEIVNGDNTPYISANLWDKTADKALLDAYKIFTVGEKKIAIVGITTPETLVKSTPAFFQNEDGEYIYDFCNDKEGTKLYTAVQTAVDAAKAEGADYVIAVGHLGIDEQSEPWTSSSVIKNTTGIDALIDGHSHSTFAKTEKNKDGKDVVVAQTGTKLANIGKLVIATDGSIYSTLVPVTTAVTPDEAVAAKVAAIKAEVDAVSNTVVAKTEVDLTTKDPVTGARAVRNAETNLGDLCADAYRDLLKTDIAFVNGGGVRADIAKGDITYGQIIAVHPFGNTACKIEVTGEQIWQALELGASAYPGESGGFLQVSGIEYTINADIKSPVVFNENKEFVKIEGEPRVTNIKVGGEALDLTKTYILGGHNYMLIQGGDGYTMFKGSKILAQEVAIDNEVLIKYITGTLEGVVAADSIYANPKGAGRITINAPVKDTTIFFTNDVHGAYENYAYAATIAKDADLLVDAGDNIQGSVATTLTNGQCMVDLMKAVGYDVAVPGNHEFDYGFDRFLEIVNGDNTPYISANLWDKTADKALLDAYKIFTVGERKIAIVGITTPETLVKSTPAFFQNENGEYIYDFCNDKEGTKLYTAVQTAVDAAKAEGADYVIAVGHLGIDEQSEPWTSTSVIKNTTGIDALIDGHSHSTFSKTEKNKDGKDVVVAQTGTKLANIGKLTITGDGKIEATLIPVTTDVTPDAAVAEKVAAVKAEVDTVSNTVVARTEVDLTTKNPVTGARAVRNAETNLGDLCADAYRDLLKTDIAFVNGGGVRADIAKGNITYGQIIAVHPFGNTACKIEVTGEQIWQALELGASAYPGESGGFLQVSGMEYTINTGIKSPVVLNENKEFVKIEGEPRVTDIKIGGEPLDLTKTYILGGHNYMLIQGGDGYTMFKGSKILAQEVAIDNEVLIKYITGTLEGVVAADSIYANPKGAGRITIISKFTDVKSTDWFFDYVTGMANDGIIKGMTETTFEPETELTRAQMVVMLYRLAGSPEVDGECTFTDVEKDAWYVKEVTWAEKNEVVNGIGDGKFDPEGKITREQLVTMIYRLANGAKVEADLSIFADAAKVSDWALDAMKWSVKVNIINGTTFEGDSKLYVDPQGNATRAEAAKILFIFTLLPVPA